MIRATAGTWLNYLTTIGFQVLFARNYGADHTSASYQLAFYLGISVSAVFINTAEAVYVPRLVHGSDGLDRSMLRNMGTLLVGGAVVCAALLSSAPQLAHLIGGKNLYSPQLVSLFRLTAAFAFAQVIAGCLAAVALTCGARFLPALAPAGPSTAGLVAMAVSPGLSVVTLYVAVLFGGIIQAVAVIPAFRHAKLAPEHSGRDANRVTVATFGQYAALAITTPLEVRLASLRSAAGGSYYVYATRALAVAQSLIVGGLLMAALGDWSRARRESGHALAERVVTRAMAATSVTLLYSVSVALLIGHELLRVLYQRGAFTPHDTNEVFNFLAIAVFGWAFESLSLLFTQALFSAHRNDLALWTGMTRMVVRVVLVTVGAVALGFIGVAIGYVISAFYGLGVNAIWVVRAQVLSSTSLASLARAAVPQLLLPAVGIVVVAVGDVPLSARLILVACLALVPAAVIYRARMKSNDVELEALQVR